MPPFRSEIAPIEKNFLFAVLAWIALTTAGGIYYFIREFHFGPEPEIVSWVLGLAVLTGILCCLPVFRNRDPRNRFVSNPLPVQLGLYAGFFILFASLAWGTYSWVVGPFLTSSFGTAGSGTYVVIEKSSGYANRRSCNHFVWLRDTESRWRAKVCLPKEQWSAASVGDPLTGVGHSSFLGRTLEHLNWGIADTSPTRAGE